MTIVLAIASGYSANAAAHVKGIDKAHSILTASSIIGWVGIGISVVSFIAMLVFAEEILTIPWLRVATTIVIYFVLFATLLVGILLAYAANIIHGDDLYGSNKDPYTMALNGAVVAITMSGVLILSFLAVKAYTYYKGHHKNTQSNTYAPGSSMGYLSSRPSKTDRYSGLADIGISSAGRYLSRRYGI